MIFELMTCDLTNEASKKEEKHDETTLKVLVGTLGILGSIIAITETIFVQNMHMNIREISPRGATLRQKAAFGYGH